MNEQDDVVVEADGFEELSKDEAAQASGKLGKLKEDLDQARKEKQEYLDGWQRSKADYVNALKRFEEEKKQAMALGTLVAVKTLIPAYDALERAKEAGQVPEGFTAIAKQIEGAFSAMGVVPFGTVGEKFDPMRHEALGTDSTDDATKDDTVSMVLERGYAVGESVLRPARVRVAHFES